MTSERQGGTRVIKVIKLVDSTGEVKNIDGKILQITTKQPPRMSRELNSELLEYRSTDTCPECHKSTVYCQTCGQPLRVETSQYCKEHNVKLEPLYVWHQTKDSYESYHVPILACPVCHVISWWADEDYNFDNKEEYFAGLRRWVEIKEA